MTSSKDLNIVIIGLSITSSWGNGHATTYRGLVKELANRGHRIHFLERDVPWYASNRDLADPPFCTTTLYSTPEELFSDLRGIVRDADAVIVGSYVPDGIDIGEWAINTCEGAVAFYDIDTPVTLAGLESGDTEYLTPELISRYDLYLSFTGGPTLKVLEEKYGSPAARPLYCSFDPAAYFPIDIPVKWDLGYMGTYSVDRQPTVNELLLTPARMDAGLRCVVAGPQYPTSIQWPQNVERLEHVPPAEHRTFYNQQRFTLNVTRQDMIAAGYSPSVRLFEAAACAVPIISDRWDGLETFFRIGEEILIADSAAQVLEILRETDEETRRSIGERARQRVISAHTAAHRAAELESYIFECLAANSKAGNPLTEENLSLSQASF